MVRTVGGRSRVIAYLRHPSDYGALSTLSSAHPTRIDALRAIAAGSAVPDAFGAADPFPTAPGLAGTTQAEATIAHLPTQPVPQAPRSEDRDDAVGDLRPTDLDMVTALTGAGLAVPPLEGLGHVLTFGPSSWGTYEPDPLAMYMFNEQVLRGALARGGDQLMVSHGGHGINSWALTTVLIRGPLAAYVQHPWGGLYGDVLARRLAIGATYARPHTLVEQLPQDPTLRPQVAVVSSPMRRSTFLLDLASGHRTTAASEADLFTLAAAAMPPTDPVGQPTEW